jgi:hypothetical protein
MIISASRIANEGLKNAGDRVGKAAHRIAKASAGPKGPDASDFIEFNSAGQAFKASAKIARVANKMIGALLDMRA